MIFVARFLDIRIKLKNSTISNSTGVTNKSLQSPHVPELRVYHGPMYQFMTFEQVLDDVKTFLVLHPTETVLMSLNEEIYTKNGENHISLTIYWH